MSKAEIIFYEYMLNKYADVTKGQLEPNQLYKAFQKLEQEVRQEMLEEQMNWLIECMETEANTYDLIIDKIQELKEKINENN